MNVSIITEARRHESGVRTEVEFAVLVEKCHQAARLATNDWNVLASEWRKLPNVRGGKLACQRKQPLGDRGTSTASSPASST